MPAKLPEETVREVLRLARNGMTVRQASREVGISYQHAYKICNQAGIYKSEIDRVRRDAIIEDIRAGLSRGEIMQKRHVTLHTIRKAALACGQFPAQVGYGGRASRYAVLADLINTPDSQNTIAARHNMTQQDIQSIAAHARIAGIKLHESRKVNY